MLFERAATLSTLLPQLKNMVDEAQKKMESVLHDAQSVCADVTAHRDGAVFESANNILRCRLSACNSLLYVDGKGGKASSKDHLAEHKAAVDTAFQDERFLRDRQESGDVEPFQKIFEVKCFSQICHDADTPTLTCSDDLKKSKHSLQDFTT